jgi:hypothetical protein
MNSEIYIFLFIYLIISSSPFFHLQLLIKNQGINGVEKRVGVQIGIKGDGRCVLSLYQGFI